MTTLFKVQLPKLMNKGRNSVFMLNYPVTTTLKTKVQMMHSEANNFDPTHCTGANTGTIAALMCFLWLKSNSVFPQISAVDSFLVLQ